MDLPHAHPILRTSHLPRAVYARSTHLRTYLFPPRLYTYTPPGSCAGFGSRPFVAGLSWTFHAFSCRIYHAHCRAHAHADRHPPSPSLHDPPPPHLPLRRAPGWLAALPRGSCARDHTVGVPVGLYATCRAFGRSCSCFLHGCCHTRLHLAVWCRALPHLARSISTRMAPARLLRTVYAHRAPAHAARAHARALHTHTHTQGRRLPLPHTALRQALHTRSALLHPFWHPAFARACACTSSLPCAPRCLFTPGLPLPHALHAPHPTHSAAHLPRVGPASLPADLTAPTLSPSTLDRGTRLQDAGLPGIVLCLCGLLSNSTS